MDPTLLFVVVVVGVIVGLMVYGFIKRLVGLVTSSATIIILALVVYTLMPQPAKASLDLTLALTGSKIFENVSEENIQTLRDVGIKVNFAGGFTYAYPVYTTVSDAPEVTNSNVYDFSTDFFTFTYVPRHIKVVTTPDKKRSHYTNTEKFRI